MEKGKAIPADGLILDLEDAVAINMKVEDYESIVICRKLLVIWSMSRFAREDTVFVRFASVSTVWKLLGEKTICVSLPTAAAMLLPYPRWRLPSRYVNPAI